VPDTAFSKGCHPTEIPSCFWSLFFIPHTEKGRTVCAVFFVLHQLISRQRWANNIFVAGTATVRERKATPYPNAPQKTVFTSVL
jgi:hypothetical protein